MKKTAYIKPEMQVVEIQHTQMLCGSPKITSISGSDGFTLDGEGFGDDAILP